MNVRLLLWWCNVTFPYTQRTKSVSLMDEAWDFRNRLCLVMLSNFCRTVFSSVSLLRLFCAFLALVGPTFVPRVLFDVVPLGIPP